MKGVDIAMYYSQKNRTNEQLVADIRMGYDVSENMELLYEQNLNLIRKIIKPYVHCIEQEDAEQEAFFGLREAVYRFEPLEDVAFMTYAKFWILQSVRRYIDQCGSCVRIPSYFRQQMHKYKKTLTEIEQTEGRTPNDSEMADRLNTTVDTIQAVRVYLQGVSSLDSPVSADDDTFTLGDTIADDTADTETTTVDKLMDAKKSEIWDIVAAYTTARQNAVLRDYFLFGRSIPVIADSYHLSTQMVSQIKNDGLKRLRIGKARRTLIEKFEVVDAGIYRNSVNKFNGRGSTVEHIAIKHIQLESEHKQMINRLRSQFQQSGDDRMLDCLDDFEKKCKELELRG
jgi:RNA polymerase primary sigma factor